MTGVQTCALPICALAGALATSYYFVSALGVDATFKVAALGNLIAGVGALAWPRPASPRPEAAVGHERGTPASDEQRLVLAAFGVSGFTSLALEVVWFRALIMFVPATTYAFTLILATVLAGIALGSAGATAWLRRQRDWFWVLAWLEVGIGVSAAASLATLGWVFARGWTDTSLGAASVAVLPPAVLMGAAFPIGLACWTGSPDGGGDTGRRIGQFYIVNLGGAILGSIASGFFLIPLFGTRASLLAIAALSLLAGLVLAFARRQTQSARVVGLTAVGLVAFVTVAIAVPDPLHAVLSRRYRGERLLWLEEGVQTTVSIQERRGRRIMYLNGLHQADDTPEVRGLHRMIGTLAMVLHPAPRAALVVGLGGGVTAGAVAQFPQTDVDVVELSNTVIKGASWFAEVNDHVLERPNVHVRVDDGRDFLAGTRRRYDVITADLIQPYKIGRAHV